MFQTKLVLVAIVSAVLSFIGSASAAERFMGTNGHMYEFIRAPSILWEDAKRISETMNFNDVFGHLATITSRQEDQSLENWRRGVIGRFGFTNTKNQQFWVGGFQLSGQQTTYAGWSWINGEGIIPRFNGGNPYANWQMEQPDDCSADSCGSLGIEDNSENYLAIGLLGKPGWNDQSIPHDMFAGYIVEYDLIPPQPNKILTYENNFENSIGTEWSNRTQSISPVGGRKFLGRFSNQTVSLALAGLPEHSGANVSFDIFIIHSMDGNANSHPWWGPDVWKLNIDDGPVLIQTTFSNLDGHYDNIIENQSYPDQYPGGNNPPLTGVSEINTLGYLSNEPAPMDSVYWIQSTFSHTGNQLILNFSYAGITDGVIDESWGIDNVKVELIKENPPAKTPVIIIPGIMGSELDDADTGDKIWLDEKLFEINDRWLLKLLLQSNGIDPDDNHRCANDFNRICTGEVCDMIWECSPGGRPIKATNVLSFDIVGIGAYDAYNELAKKLNDNGYQDKIFLFPYDWRLDLRTSAEKLKEKIDEVCSSTGSSKVNIIAHSLGGIVTRIYLRKHIADHRVDNVIFLGTPHLLTFPNYLE